jgi:hypothetical protein
MRAKINSMKWRAASLLSVTLILSQLLPLFISSASASTLAQTLVQFNNMTASGTTTGTICINTTSATAVKSWVVAFPTGYVASGTAANWQNTNLNTTSNSAWPAGASPWPAVTSATASVSTPSVTWTNSLAQTMTPGTVYCYNWTNAALTQNTVAANNEQGTITTQTTGSVTIDTGTFATATVANDQINVTGTVLPSFSVYFNANTDPLGTLSSASVNSNSASTITVNSNAKNGWSAWVQSTLVGAHAGLYSPTALYTIRSDLTPAPGASASTLTAGTEGMNVGIAYAQTSGTCTSGSAVPTTFSGAGKGGGIDNLAFYPIIGCSGTTNAGVITPTNYASINGATPYATDYSDLETYVAAGNF